LYWYWVGLVPRLDESPRESSCPVTVPAAHGIRMPDVAASSFLHGACPDQRCFAM
ncbi:hypothetical protein NDU88_001942, partial [Pleurodeles waltl]